MSKVVLIGGCGFIGHHLALSLDHDVTCVDSLMVNNLYAIRGDERYEGFLNERLELLQKKNIPVIRADARDYNLLSEVVGRIKPDWIIHLAAIAHIDRAKKDPFSTFDHSLRTLENSLDIAKACDSRFIYFSSSTVYGDFSKPVIDESEPLLPKGMYGKLKLAGELMCCAYVEDYKLPVTIVRPQALYGPRCISGRVTQVFIERAMEGLPLKVNGSAMHDFTYIEDLCDGVRGIMEKEAYGTFNITGENATSLDDLARIVVERFPVKIKKGKPDGKPKRGTMSCQRLRDVTGYVPRNDIRTGMNKLMDWYEGRES